MKSNSIKHWIVLCFTAILLFATVASAAAKFHEAYSSAIRYGEERATICAANVSHLMLHQWDMDAIFCSDDNEEYFEAQKVLRGLCKIYELDNLYVYSIDPEAPSRYYYLCVSDNQKKEKRLQNMLLRHTIPVDELSEAELAVLSGEKEVQRGTLHDQFGDEYVWVSPCMDGNGELAAIIGMDFSYDTIKSIVLRNFTVDMIPFTLSLSTGLLILLFLVQRRIVDPIRALSASMARFATDSRQKPDVPKISSHDEIGEIAASYEKMTEDISAYVNNIEQLTREQLETNVQLEVARRIQYGLVPEETDLKGKSFRITAVTRPAKAIGGDFYDCFQRDENSVCIVMGDVSGKGISAAIFMAMIKTIIREKLMVGLSPAETLNQTNEQVCSRNPENLFATAFVAVLDINTGELCYANAGHTYPVLLKENPEFLFPDSGIAIGMFENSDLKDYTITLSPTEGILLYTDGLTEAVSPQNTFFGMDRLLDVVKGIQIEADASREVVLKVSRAVAEFCDSNEPFDDMAILTLARSESGCQGLKLPVTLSSFDEIKKAVFTAAGDTPEIRRALLACDETLTNIINYSGAENLFFSCEKEGGKLSVFFSDDGIPFDPTAAPTEEKDFEFLDNGGMGLNLIRKSVSSMRYERKNNRNNFMLYFPLAQ